MSCDSSGLCDIIDYHQFWLYFGLLLWLSPPFETSPKTTDQSTMTAPRVYQPYRLMQVRNSATNHLLLPSVCQRIKDLGIRKSTKGCSDCVTARLDACLFNARSIKNKTIDLLDCTVDHELDLFFFTDTWLGQYCEGPNHQWKPMPCLKFLSPHAQKDETRWRGRSTLQISSEHQKTLSGLRTIILRVPGMLPDI